MFICFLCFQNDSNQLPDHSAIELSPSTRLTMPARPIGPLESSRISLMDADTVDREEDIELTMPDVTTYAPDVTPDEMNPNETTFDVERPNRSVAAEASEM